MSGRPRSRLAANFLRAAAYTAAFVWLALVYVGGTLASRPETGAHSRLAGWTVLLVAAAVMIATMDHWVRYIQLIFGSGILGGLLATGTGHLLNGEPFSRLVAAAITALFVGCSLISRTLARRRLMMVDRVAILAFLAAFVGGILKGTPASGLVGLSIGFGFLSIGWLVRAYPSDQSNVRERRRTEPE